MVPFILLSHPRSGTTVVSHALADHPQILFYGEIFHRHLGRRVEEAARRTLGSGVARASPHGIEACPNEDDGAAYLERFFTRALPAWAVGFKIFYTHARAGPIARAWAHLADRPDLKILHVQRSNLLECLISFERANRTSVWHSTSAQEAGPFDISPARCRAFFEEHVGARRAVQPLLDTHAVLEIRYEEIASSFTDCLGRIYSFLGVNANAPAAPQLAKLAQGRPPEQLTNYEELRRHFQHTPFAAFFSW